MTPTYVLAESDFYLSLQGCHELNAFQNCQEIPFPEIAEYLQLNPRIYD